MSGQEAQPPSQTASVLPMVVGPTTILLGLALVTYSLRIYSRLYPYWNLQWDDHVMSLAVAVTIVNWALTLSIQVTSGGRTPDTIPKIVHTLKFAYISRLMWVWSVTFIKVSVALMMLRIKQTPAWRRGISALVATLLIFGIAMTISLLTQCWPIRKNWDITSLVGSCWSVNGQSIFTYVTTALFAATDIVCALLPLTFITKINRSLRERVALAILMGLGIIACICGIMKAVLLKHVLTSTDPMEVGTAVAVWTYSEEYIGIFAANIPCLRSLLQEAFRALGGHLTGSGSRGQTLTGEHTHSYDHRQSQFTESSNYHQYMQKDDLEINGMGAGGQVLVTHHIETIIDKRSVSEHLDGVPESKWNAKSYLDD